MFDVAKAMVLASFPEGLTDIEIKRRLCERLYGDEVDLSAFVEHLSSLQPESKPEKCEDVERQRQDCALE